MEKVKLIRGSEERAEEIINILINLGGINQACLRCNNSDNYYYTNCFGHVDYVSLTRGESLVCEGVAEIYELPPLQPKCELNPFDKVLVRNFKDDKWKCSIFSHEEDGYYVCVSTCWNYCIPYEGNEHLLGTTNSPR